MVTIIFEAHSTTVDNENHVATGHADSELSELGVKQSKELGERYAASDFAVIFCSDFMRSYRTAEIAFGGQVPIIRDPRLRECDYGDFTQKPSSEVDAEKPKRIREPFPNGESYEQTTARMKSFLKDLHDRFDGKRVMIIGHRTTQYGLEHLVNHVPLLQLVSASFKWQPGWRYELTNTA